MKPIQQQTKRGGKNGEGDAERGLMSRGSVYTGSGELKNNFKCYGGKQ